MISARNFERELTEVAQGSWRWAHSGCCDEEPRHRGVNIFGKGAHLAAYCLMDQDCVQPKPPPLGRAAFCAVSEMQGTPWSAVPGRFDLAPSAVYTGARRHQKHSRQGRGGTPDQAQAVVPDAPMPMPANRCVAAAIRLIASVECWSFSTLRIEIAARALSGRVPVAERGAVTPELMHVPVMADRPVFHFFSFTVRNLRSLRA